MMKKKNKRIGLSAIAAGWLFAWGILSLTGCSSHQDSPAPVAGTVEGPVEILTIRTEEVPVRREATGVVTSAMEATMSARETGTVESIRIREGDRVRKGEILVVLDSRELEARLSGAEAEVENASVRYGRMEKLFSMESVTRQELDNAARTLKVAEAAKKALEARRADRTIRAPFDGVVTEKRIEAGELAAPGRPLLRLVDNRRLRLEAAVPEAEIGYLLAGDPVTVRLDALEMAGNTGTVAEVVPSSDPATHSFLVKVDLPEWPGLKTGLFGRMVYEAGTYKTVRVPVSSIRVRGALSSVYIVDDDGVIRSRLIRTGLSDGGRVEVLSGVTAGERIVTHAREDLEGKTVGKTRDDG